MSVLSHFPVKHTERCAFVHCLFDRFGQFEIAHKHGIDVKTELVESWLCLSANGVADFKIVCRKFERGDFALAEHVGKLRKHD